MPRKKARKATVAATEVVSEPTAAHRAFAISHILQKIIQHVPRKDIGTVAGTSDAFFQQAASRRWQRLEQHEAERLSRKTGVSSATFSVLRLTHGSAETRQDLPPLCPDYRSGNLECFCAFTVPSERQELAAKIPIPQDSEIIVSAVKGARFHWQSGMVVDSDSPCPRATIPVVWSRDHI